MRMSSLPFRPHGCDVRERYAVDAATDVRLAVLRRGTWAPPASRQHCEAIRDAAEAPPCPPASSRALLVGRVVRGGRLVRRHGDRLGPGFALDDAHLDLRVVRPGV